MLSCDLEESYTECFVHDWEALAEWLALGSPAGSWPIFCDCHVAKDYSLAAHQPYLQWQVTLSSMASASGDTGGSLSLLRSCNNN